VAGKKKGGLKGRDLYELSRKREEQKWGRLKSELKKKKGINVEVREKIKAWGKFL